VVRYASTGGRRCNGAIGLALIALACLLPQAATAHAHDADEDDTETTSWHEKTTAHVEASREAWAGASVMSKARAVYSGTTLAPFGSLQQDGLRLRSVASMGLYTYQGRRFDAQTGDAVITRFQGLTTRTDALIGYQWSTGSLTAKAFIGATWRREVISPTDDEVYLPKQTPGITGALELWYNWSPQHWSSLDLGYAAPLQTYSLRLRAAQKLDEAWSIGGEVAAFGTVDASARRLGAFVRFDNGHHELSVNAGLHQQGNGDRSRYGGAQWLRRF
jgi:Cellulose biosynthesis protein BcsS